MNDFAETVAGARDLVADLWRDGEWQGTASSCAQLAEQIGGMLARFPEAVEIAEAQACAWNVASRQSRSEPNWRRPIAELTALHGRFPTSPAIARELTEALALTFVDLEALAARAEQAERIAAIQVRFPDDAHIADDLAFALWSVGLRTKEAGPRAVLVQRAEELSQRFPESEAIARSLADVLTLPGRAGGLLECVRVVQRIEDLQQRFPESERIARRLAQALAAEAVARDPLVERERIVARIEDLLARMPAAAGVAGHLAMAIFAVSTLHKGVAEQLHCAARIEPLLARHPEESRIAFGLARTLANATIASADPREVDGIVTRVRALQQRFVWHGGVAWQLGVALCSLTTCSSVASRSIAAADEIGQLFARFPGRDLAGPLALSLRNASADATDLDVRMQLATRGQALYDRFADDAEIGEQLAASLFHANLSTSEPAQRQHLLERVEQLQARFPQSASIAFELERSRSRAATTAPTTQPQRQAPAPPSPVLRWLLDSDPSIRWQVMRDLIGAPADEVAAERARVATAGAGARLLALQGADGRWGGAAWNRGWNSTMHVLMLLRDMGLDPASDQARCAVGRVRDRVTWQGDAAFAGNAFFAGEVEPCINGQVAAVGACFGQDVRGIVDRLLAEQLPDGGWNCEAANGSTRSSFNTTICVLEALLEHERAVGKSPAVTGARLRGQEYLLERRMLRRLSTGEVIRDRKGNHDWTRFAFPTWWHYDVLRGLDHLRRAGVAPDERAAEAIDLVASKRDGDGRWPLAARHAGVMPVEVDEGEGRPSRWNTLRALRVLNWFSGS